MRTSGVGKGGALLLAMGAVAIGAAGCASQGAHVSADKAAAGSSTTPGATATTSSVPVPTPSATTPTTAATTAAPTTAAPTTKPSTTKPTLTPTKTTPKPTPTSTTGTGWLAGVPLGSNKPGALDPRCTTGRAICVDMSTRTLLWVVDGKVQYGMDVRFGDENNPTRPGGWTIQSKIKDCISNLYHTPMPDAMFFSGGEAVHFSIDFKTYGYAHHSHGCINVRDRAAVDRLFADTRIGDKVIVY